MHRNKGFSLIELMVVVVIVGILAAIAIPNYSEYVLRSRVVEAVSGLADMRVRMEQFFQDNRTYAGTVVAGGCPIGLPAAENFTFTCSKLTANTYTLTATGKKTMDGFSYAVNQSNQRSSTMTTPSKWTGNSACWVLNRGGSC